MQKNINSSERKKTRDKKKGKKEDLYLKGNKVICVFDQKEYGGMILASGVTNSFLKKDNNTYTITSSADDYDKDVTLTDISMLNENGIWLSGALLSNRYPLVSHIGFCVKQAFLFSELVKEQTFH